MNLSEAIGIGIKQLNQQLRLIKTLVRDEHSLLLETNGTTLTLAISRSKSYHDLQEIARTEVPYLSTNLISGTMPASMRKLFKKLPKEYDSRQVDDKLVLTNGIFKYTIVLT